MYVALKVFDSYKIEKIIGVTFIIFFNGSSHKIVYFILLLRGGRPRTVSRDKDQLEASRGGPFR